MDEKPAPIIDKKSYLIATLALVFSIYYFINTTDSPTNSIIAAIITAGLTWISYIILRWFYLALHSK